MQRREKILAIAVAALAALFIAQVGVKSLNEAWTTRTERLNAATKELDQKRQIIQRGEHAAQRLERWRERSLPADHANASTLYQNWLFRLANESDLQRVEVTAQQMKGKEDGVHTLRVSLTAQATLQQATEFLYRFYNVQQLHNIARLSITPNSGDQLSLAFTIEALVVPGANREGLNTEDGERLQGQVLADYEKTIVQRNIFAPYKPPPPPTQIAVAPPAPAPFDNAKFAKVTAILHRGGSPQVWLNVQTTGELLQLEEGDEFSVGTLTGTILRIGLQDVDIEADGKTLTVALGKSLDEGAVQ